MGSAFSLGARGAYEQPWTQGSAHLSNLLKQSQLIWDDGSEVMVFVLGFFP